MSLKILFRELWQIFLSDAGRNLKQFYLNTITLVIITKPTIRRNNKSCRITITSSTITTQTKMLKSLEKMPFQVIFILSTRENDKSCKDRKEASL